MVDELRPLPLGIAAGIAYGLCIFLLGLMATFTEMGTVLVNTLGTAYIGYAPTVVGSVIGGIWAFIDAFVFVYIAAWIYNYLLKTGIR
jgi:hypothetical protein